MGKVDRGLQRNRGNGLGYTFGKMILKTLKEEGIRREELCRGLCDESMFTRYMNGRYYLDRLLMTALLQRMGKSPDKFCSMLTEEEYVYFGWRHEAELAQQRGDWREIERLLGKEAQVNCNERLQRQFSLLLQAIIQEKCYSRREECLRLLEEALSMTLPGFTAGLMESGDALRIARMRLGTQEINILLLWQALQPDREKAFLLMEGLVKNIDAHYTDRQEKCKIYPKAAAQYITMLNGKGMYYEGIAIAKKALELIGETGYVESLLQILGQYTEIMEKVHSMEKVPAEDCTGVREQYEVWKKIMGKYGRQEEDAMSYLFCMSQEIELYHEMIRGSRQEKGYTQEDLSKDICEPATLSRIENGRKPARRTYQGLADRLPLPKENYYSTIVADRFETLELRWEYETQVKNKQFKKAERLKDLLKKELDVSIVCNRQYIEQAELVLKRAIGEIEPQDCFERLKEILSYSISRMPEDEQVEQWPEEFWRHVFTEREMSILLIIADTFFEKKKWEQAAYLLEKMLEYYGRSKVSLEVHYRIVSLIYGRLTVPYCRLGLYDKAMEYAEKGILLSIQQGSCKEFCKFLTNKAYALEHLGEKADAIVYYRMAHISSKVFWKGGHEVAARAYKRLTGMDIE